MRVHRGTGGTFFPWLDRVPVPTVWGRSSTLLVLSETCRAPPPRRRPASRRPRPRRRGHARARRHAAARPSGGPDRLLHGLRVRGADAPHEPRPARARQVVAQGRPVPRLPRPRPGVQVPVERQHVPRPRPRHGGPGLHEPLGQGLPQEERLAVHDPDDPAQARLLDVHGREHRRQQLARHRRLLQVRLLVVRVGLRRVHDQHRARRDRPEDVDAQLGPPLQHPGRVRPVRLRGVESQRRPEVLRLHLRQGRPEAGRRHRPVRVAAWPAATRSGGRTRRRSAPTSAMASGSRTARCRSTARRSAAGRTTST